MIVSHRFGAVLACAALVLTSTVATAPRVAFPAPDQAEAGPKSQPALAAAQPEADPRLEETIGKEGSRDRDTPVLVHADGTVTIQPNAVTSRWAAEGRTTRVRYGFGLPAKAPERRWLEDDAIPIFQTSWDQDGIHYTQRVMVTSLGTNDPASSAPAVNDAVLVVQIGGQNNASDYTTARAVFEVKVGNRPLALELREGLVFVAGSNDPWPLAAVDVATEGIASANGVQLRFQGDMPPGTSGAMTIKIPAGRLASPAAIGRMTDLEFDEEIRRVKRAWKNRPGDARPFFPVAWAEPAQ